MGRTKRQSHIECPRGILGEHQGFCFGRSSFSFAGRLSFTHMHSTARYPFHISLFGLASGQVQDSRMLFLSD